MEARMVLWREGVEPFIKIADWEEVVETDNGGVLGKDISLYSDMVIVDGKEHHIMTMSSAPSFNR